MTLPAVAGWIIDFRTARFIFTSGNNQWIHHCVGLCGDGMLFMSHVEEDDFKSLPQTKAAFLDDNNCLVVPDEDVRGRCVSLVSSPLTKNLVKGNDSAIFITATAASKQYGVISNHRSPVFSTVFDLCVANGIPIFSAVDYFKELP